MGETPETDADGTAKPKEGAKVCIELPVLAHRVSFSRPGQLSDFWMQEKIKNRIIHSCVLSICGAIPPLPLVIHTHGDAFALNVGIGESGADPSRRANPTLAVRSENARRYLLPPCVLAHVRL